MGDCVICGQPAGFFKLVHPECEESNRQKAEQAQTAAAAGAYRKKKIELVLLAAARHGTPENRAIAVATLSDAKRAGLLAPEDAIDLAYSSWRKAAGDALEDGLLTAEEEQSLMAFAEQFGVAHKSAPETPQLTKAAILRDLAAGLVRPRITVSGQLPFNLLKSENLIWLFQGVEAFTTKTSRIYQGGSQGLSIRVMKGVYYRPSSFKGAATTTETKISLGTGLLGVTDRSIYFAAPGKAVRVKFSEIVAFDRYSDGFGVNREKSDKPLTFKTGDGWFSYNLVGALAAQSPA